MKSLARNLLSSLGKFSDRINYFRSTASKLLMCSRQLSLLDLFTLADGSARSHYGVTDLVRL